MTASKEEQSIERARLKASQNKPSNRPPSKKAPPCEDVTPEALSVIPAALGDEEEVYEEYWCGIFEGAPVQAIHVGGVDFQLFTETILDTQGPVTKRNRHNGIVCNLTRDQIERVRGEANRMIVRERGSGENVKPFLVSDDRYDIFLHNLTRQPTNLAPKMARFKRHKGDRVIGQYIYMIPAAEVHKYLGSSWFRKGEEEITKGVPAVLLPEEARIPSDNEIRTWAREYAGEHDMEILRKEPMAVA